MIEMKVSIKDSSYPNGKGVHGCRQDGKRRPVVSQNVCRDYVYGVQMIFAGWWLIGGGWGPVKVQMTPNADSASGWALTAPVTRLEFLLICCTPYGHCKTLVGAVEAKTDGMIHPRKIESGVREQKPDGEKNTGLYDCRKGRCSGWTLNLERTARSERVLSGGD
ncbi:hypothetical protein N7474_008041 [Penicillium riverlandense]|uniref:uncharacterized protein n=1 Tax=Penicillium riverlandense TaxID=1903569 RepID=UPI002549B0E9|nr:uncharacterized protein N7474_008041 [Penicillium riverlandense]KAJ5811740.1 hypothetical protein N7474_008041 [Penicillium riverlandense]